MRTLILDNTICRLFLREGSLTRRWVPGPATIHPAPWRPLPKSNSFDRLILTGSEASILDQKGWMNREKEFVAGAVDAGKPVLGICFGHQLLAGVLWGEQCVRRAPVAEFGWHMVDLDATDPLFTGMPSKAVFFCSHFDEVVNPPAGARVTAQNDQCAVHAFRLENKPVWGVQFHPEIDKLSGMLILAYFGPIRRKIAVDLKEALRQAQKPVYASTVFENFQKVSS